MYVWLIAHPNIPNDLENMTNFADVVNVGINIEGGRMKLKISNHRRFRIWITSIVLNILTR
jgi:hypothetical protein